MNSDNKWFPVASVSEQVNIPPETVRRYARQYRDFLTIKRGEKKAYLIHESSFATIKEIRSLLEQGHQHGQVKHLLDDTADSHVPAKRAETEESLVNEPPIHKEMMEELQNLGEQNQQLLAMLHHMHERMNGYEELLLQQHSFPSEQMDEQEKEQRDYERKRDEYLMKAMNDMQEKKRESVSTKERTRIFTRLFKK
ncbi:MerR family transcriptional regulator [Oceanobacillus alkalisoli]|uniref:MerR family transcriptional regulator n=1 Tax=Oceanobacillus alkalisoli TaxID=2925113 RepID=UPI001EEFCDC3|nr:MerR family transcriptional regulator [Oceanobacillus alkalisoli]MCF3944212.1 MerR family transcriptional regulator [Oceanobacillus alkalisoli]MCG5103177.1 MerR family transcriptional regulator [Oceanobacillus alkalisoli]